MMVEESWVIFIFGTKINKQLLNVRFPKLFLSRVYTRCFWIYQRIDNTTHSRLLCLHVDVRSFLRRRIIMLPSFAKLKKMIWLCIQERPQVKLKSINTSLYYIWSFKTKLKDATLFCLLLQNVIQDYLLILVQV